MQYRKKDIAYNLTHAVFAVSITWEPMKSAFDGQFQTVLVSVVVVVVFFFILKTLK